MSRVHSEYVARCAGLEENYWLLSRYDRGPNNTLRAVRVPEKIIFNKLPIFIQELMTLANMTTTDKIHGNVITLGAHYVQIYGHVYWLYSDNKVLVVDTEKVSM